MNTSFALSLLLLVAAHTTTAADTFVPPEGKRWGLTSLESAVRAALQGGEKPESQAR